MKCLNHEQRGILHCNKDMEIIIDDIAINGERMYGGIAFRCGDCQLIDVYPDGNVVVSLKEG